MYKWKQFIKGPDLNDELLNSDQDQSINAAGSSGNTRRPEALDGHSAKEIYERIVSESSTPSGGNIKAKNDDGAHEHEAPPLRRLRLTQLMGLCESNDIQELSKYIECYSDELDLNEVDQFGWTLLMSAACSGSVDCVELLLRAGSDWTLTDKSGFTAFHLAQRKHKTHVCGLIENWVKVRQTEQDQGDSSDTSDEGESESKFCAACNINYTNEKKHYKSIAHLLCTSNYSDYEKVHYGIPESNKGFQLMLKTGWDRRGLGISGDGQKFPVKTVLKRDRKGLGQTGSESENKIAKITHFGPFDTAAVERNKLDDRLERFGTVKKKEEEKRRNKQKIKEIEYRRELGSI